MSEKRILIQEYDENPCLSLANLFKKAKYTGITRQEAVDRMEKAICASNMAPDCLWECETCDRWKGSDKEAAEAALNALLEGHNDER